MVPSAFAIWPGNPSRNHGLTRQNALYAGDPEDLLLQSEDLLAPALGRGSPFGLRGVYEKALVSTPKKVPLLCCRLVLGTGENRETKNLRRDLYTSVVCLLAAGLFEKSSSAGRLTPRRGFLGPLKKFPSRARRLSCSPRTHVRCGASSNQISRSLSQGPRCEPDSSSCASGGVSPLSESPPPRPEKKHTMRRLESYSLDPSIRSPLNSLPGIIMSAEASFWGSDRSDENYFWGISTPLHEQAW